MGSKAHAAFTENCKEIDRLLEIHGDVTPEGRGRKWEVEALHKAAIVLLTAFWEAFCEDLADEGVRHLVQHGSADRLPSHLRQLIAKELKNEKHELAIWQLADDGWRIVLTDRFDRLQQERNRKLNTPKTAQINELFSQTLGIEKVAQGWYWPGMKAARAQTKLDDYVTLRGEVAHRGTAANSVNKTHVTGYQNHAQRLVTRTERTVGTALAAATGEQPWS